MTQCPENVECSDDKFLCADGSCQAKKEKCPNIMGCPGDAFRCSNGVDCVDLFANETCPVNLCPANTPYKCLDGLCVETKSHCSSIIQIPVKEENHCLQEQDGYLIPCADGRCVASSE